jgi:HK97 family phage major capsid protein
MAAEPIEMNKSDLDRLVEDTVQKYAKKSKEEFDASIDALRAEVLGPERSEEIAATRDKARSDFNQMPARQQVAMVDQAKAALFDGTARQLGETRAYRGANSPLPDGLQKSGWGRGRLFVRAMMLFTRSQNHINGTVASRWEWCAKEARANNNHDLADIIEQRVLTAGDAGKAGALVPEIFSTDFIAALYATTIMRRAGAVVVDISESGSLTIGRQNNTATANWIGEVTSQTESEGTYGQLKLDARKLGVFVPISNDAIRFARGQFDSLVASDMLNVAALAEDIAFIRGSGNEYVPKGLKNWVKSDNAFAANTAGADAFEKQSTDLIKLQFKVENSKVPIVNPAFLMSTREKSGLMLTKTSNGDAFAFRDEMVMNGTLMGAPFYSSQQIPTNLNSTESELYYAEMSQCVIGEAVTTELEWNPYGSFTDSNSVVQNSFQQDEMVGRLIHMVDFVLRHDGAAAYVNNAEYGTALD